jgi:alkylated DNA repair dioxygenase AlkB
MSPTDSTQRDLFETGLPEGFAIRDDVISKEEEADAVRHFETLPFKPFEFHGYLGKRRVVSFGLRYDYSDRVVRESAPMPTFLSGLRNLAADFAHVPAVCLKQVLVTEYAAGASIGWHRDKPIFDDIVAISLVSPCRLRFRLKEADRWKRAALTLAPRSTYLLRGAARHTWYHSIPPVPALRYSVTFRNLAEKDLKP